MQIKTSKKSFMTIESVALTDIVMNLFIFFFISFSLLYTFNPNRESKIEVKLPETTLKDEKGKEGPLVVTVTSGNEIFIGQDRVFPNKLQFEIQKRADLAKKNGLIVRADKLASVDYLVRVLDSAKQVGVRKLSVAVEQA